jgi:hypothetical protein
VQVAPKIIDPLEKTQGCEDKERGWRICAIRIGTAGENDWSSIEGVATITIE